MFVHVPSRKKLPPPWATPLLVFSSMAVFLWLALLPAGPAWHETVARWGALGGSFPLEPQNVLHAFADGRALKLVTALFIHTDWLHLLGNLLFLVIFGLPAERALGPWRFLVLFLLGGAVANLVAVSVMDAPARTIVGSSGAVSAAIGAYLALFPRAKLGIVVPLGLFLEFVRAPASLLICIWALLQLIFTFVGPTFGAVAWWAHVTGFVFGVIYALLSRNAVVRRLRGA
jgi:membrane associated rhomboid family serine protease